MASHVFPCPSSLFHGHRHPRFPRPCIKILEHQWESRLSCSTGRIHVCGVARAWTVQFACLVLVVETPCQNNALLLSSEDFKALCRHQTHLTSPLCSWWAWLLKRIIAKQRQAFAFSPGEAKGWLNYIPQHLEPCRNFWWGKASLGSLSCLSETETGSCPCFLTTINKVSPFWDWRSQYMDSQCLGEA